MLWFSCQVVSNSFETPWTIACQVPLPMGFPRQEYWNALPFPSTGALPDPGIDPASPALGGGFLTTEPPGKPMLGLTPKVKTLFHMFISHVFLSVFFVHQHIREF